MSQEKIQIQQKVIAILKTIIDPEVGINIWDFGLIYGVNIVETENDICTTNLQKIENQKTERIGFICEIVMTFTSVNCPAIDLLPMEIKERIATLQEVNLETKIEIVWEPKWEVSLLSEEIQFELGLL